MTAPNRRWPRFGLRTLFAVVSVLGCWLGWQVSVVRERSAMRLAIEASGANIVKGDIPTTLSAPQMAIVRRGEPIRLSWIRRALGDEPVALIVFPGEPSPSDLARAEHFQEASILRFVRFTSFTPATQ